MRAMIVSAVFLVAPAFAGKPLPTPPEKKVVGLAEAIRIEPSLAEASLEEGGVRVWRHQVVERGASFLKPHFVDFNLAPGDVLVVRSASGRVVEELTGLGPKKAGTFWGLSAFGDTLDLELRVRRPYAQLPFVIDQIIVGDPGMFEPLDLGANPESVCAPPNYENVACYFAGGPTPDAGKEANLRASVGVMSVGTNPVSSGTWCSGSTVSSEGHVLTNQHCIEDQAGCNGAEFVYRYWRTGCAGGTPIAVDWVAVRCDEVLAQSPFVSCDQGLSDLDFTLASVQSTAGVDEFGFVQVDGSTPLTDGEALYIVQHPDGRPKEIAHGSGADVDVDGTVLRYYDTLDTEGGSSGSPIFREADDALVGLHHCGGCETAGVGNRGMLMTDIYPHIESFLCTEDVVVGGSGEGLEEVSGDGDALMEPGETWQFWPKVRNRACSGDAENVTAGIEMTAGSAPVTLLDTTASFGTVGPGAAAVAQAPVRFEVGAACGGEVSLDLVDVAATNIVDPLGDFPGVMAETVGGDVYTNLMTVDFSSGIPAGWTVVDGGTGTNAARTWTTANPGNRSVGLTPPFVIADSDNLGSGQSMDEQLISPVLAVPAGFDGIEVAFAHNFRYYDSGQPEKGDVDVRSAATAGAWTNKARYTASTSGLVALDVTAEAAGQADFQVRFHYYDAIWEWWWAVDDIAVRGVSAECETFSGIFADGFESGDTSAWIVGP